ncbi:MAG: ATP-binding cassette domain-containing protein [Streptosporangiales bacterium]|nr:ATP-binding cassette domain-containing protein [Streptosporangiales bacterium]
MISAESITRRFGGLHALRGVSLAVEQGERRALIGPNGAGKTTLLNVLSGVDRPTSGTVRYKSRAITTMPPHRRAALGIGRTFQVADLFDDLPVVRNLELAICGRERLTFRTLRSLSRHREIADEAVESTRRWGLENHADIQVGKLAYGVRRIVEIAMAMMSRPDLLLLDEPAAGLSTEEITTLMDVVSGLDPQLTTILVEHNMDVVFALCERVTVLATGELIADGSPEEIRSNDDVIRAYLGMRL